MNSNTPAVARAAHYYKAPAAIFSRGNPNGMTLNGEINEVVHMYNPSHGVHREYASCRNGAYHCYFTCRRASVTCEACRKIEMIPDPVVESS